MEVQNGSHRKARTGMEDQSILGIYWGLSGPLAGRLGSHLASDSPGAVVFGGSAALFCGRGSNVFQPPQGTHVDRNYRYGGSANLGRLGL